MQAQRYWSREFDLLGFVVSASCLTQILYPWTKSEVDSMLNFWGISIWRCQSLYALICICQSPFARCVKLWSCYADTLQAKKMLLLSLLPQVVHQLSSVSNGSCFAFIQWLDTVMQFVSWTMVLVLSLTPFRDWVLRPTRWPCSHPTMGLQHFPKLRVTLHR